MHGAARPARICRPGWLHRLRPVDVLTRRERPKPGRARTRYLSESDIQRLLVQSQQDALATDATLIFAGLRVSELLGLTWDDIDFAHNLTHVRRQMSRRGDQVPLKTEAGEREVIMMNQLAPLLRERKLAARFSANEDLVIGNGVGRTLGYTRLRGTFAAAVGKAGLEDVTPHTCRHTFASILVDQGASVEFVSQQLAHASTKTTRDIYVHLFRARDQADAARGSWTLPLATCCGSAERTDRTASSSSPSESNPAFAGGCAYGRKRMERHVIDWQVGERVRRAPRESGTCASRSTTRLHHLRAPAAATLKPATGFAGPRPASSGGGREGVLRPIF
jgi:hypothetical protein